MPRIKTDVGLSQPWGYCPVGFCFVAIAPSWVQQPPGGDVATRWQIELGNQWKRMHIVDAVKEETGVDFWQEIQ